MAGARITKTTLLAGAAFPGGIRVTAFDLIAGVANPGPIRITQFSMLAAVGERPGRGLINTNFRYLRAQSINRLFYLTRLESTSTVSSFAADGGQGVPGGGNGWEIELVAGPIPEFNPYKPQVPESLIDIPGAGREFFDYVEENQKTLRLQHNLTQAGDTTFPFQLIINTHTDKHYTLGSIGKFYHEDYGMILARYVRFEKMNPAVAPTAPVGLIAKTGSLDWVVTNRLELSSPYLCVGVNASYVMPVDGEYGWVVVDGVNLQALTNTSDSQALNEAFVWSASGEVKNAGPGVIIARRVNIPTNTNLLRGQAWIRLESLSEGAIETALDPYIQAIAQLQEDVAQLQEATGVNGELTTLQAQLAVLSSRLDAEANTRRAADTAINSRISAIDAVTDAELEAAIHNVETLVASVALGLNASIDATHAIAVEALEKANQALALNIGAIEDQISQILIMLDELNTRAKGKFPVVDGSIPPNLVYLDDGSLVYTETY